MNRTYSTPNFDAKIRRALCADGSWIHYLIITGGEYYVIPRKLYWAMRLIGWPRHEFEQPDWI